jgi:hypothetical protein
VCNDEWGGNCVVLNDDDDDDDEMGEIGGGKICECGQTCGNANKYGGAESHTCRR